MRRNQIFLLTFFLLLILPPLDSIFHFSPVKDLFEKRLPVPKPDLPHNFSEAKKFPQNFEKFFNDNYGFRKTLIAINSDVMDDIFGESPDARAVIGKDGWLFFDNENSLLDASGKAEISDELIARGVRSFGENWQKMRAKNIDYLLVIAADKSSVYPEFLPSYIKPGESHRIDKFLTALLAKYPDFPVLDLREVLKKAKEIEVVYHKTDTHWNNIGAHYGYVEIMKILSQKDKKLIPHLRQDFTEKFAGFVRGDIALIMNSSNGDLIYNFLPKFNRDFYSVKPSEADKIKFRKPVFFAKNEKNLPKIFVYNDSFFGNLFWLISDHFSQSFFAHETPCDLNYETIKNLHPNFVIQEFWEGRLELVLSGCLTK